MYALVFKVLIMLLAFSRASCIRLLKEGPMIDSEGREYKVAPLKHIEERQGLPSVGASTVHMKCSESAMILLVNSDLYNNGHHVSADELSLGYGREQNGCQAVPVGKTKLIIEAGLEDCGSKVTMEDDSVIYSNKLVYFPHQDNGIITRVISAVIPVSCHYQRKHFVSSNIGLPVHPLPLVTTTINPVIKQSDFSLRLMTEDWQRERFSNKYRLGESLHIEASIRDVEVSRRLYVESCVATLEPNVSSVPRYYFIEDHGCLMDSMDDSNSRFLSRTRTDRLRLQLDAFKFQQDYRNTIYITCQLKALKGEFTSPISKACNYANGRWSSVDRNHEVCRCCSSSCARSLRDQLGNGNPFWILRRGSKGSMRCDVVSLVPVVILP
ncbi:hypothetical protein UPYG_G00113310 [Umbra pygmaea]|uniref:Zona pellucida sperm-binding protein 3 n=1 Tax=Umbra pygmaea TaxID=75934 RepID=A0ABD0X3N3_UMBPY